MPGNEWPAATGVREGSYPKGYWKQLVHPFAMNPFDKTLDVPEPSSPQVGRPIIGARW